MEELVEFIQSNPDPRELKRALAVQMVKRLFISTDLEILNVSDSFISKWWLVFEADGGLATELSRQQGYLNAGSGKR